MGRVTETTSEWTKDTLLNADVVAAHERTMFLHSVAILGAITVKELLEGEENLGITRPIEWGFLHRLGPTTEWTPYTWQSLPINIGEAQVNDIGLTHKFISLRAMGLLENRTKRTLLGARKTEVLFGDTYAILRHLGNSAISPTELISLPEHRHPYIDRNYYCRDVRYLDMWTPESQVRDYDFRTSDITEFMNDLRFLADAAQQDVNRHVLGNSQERAEELSRVFLAGHARNQLDKVEDIPNSNTSSSRKK